MVYKKSLVGFVMVLLFLVGLLTLLLRSRNVPSSSQVRETIRKKLINAGYSERMANYWFAVSAFETGNFNSTLFKKYNNLFGMSYPTVGIDYGKVTLTDGGKPHDFSTYPSISESVDDLIEYLVALKYPRDFETPDQLVSFMKAKNYFGSDAKVYLAGVKRYLK